MFRMKLRIPLISQVAQELYSISEEESLFSVTTPFVMMY
jgi:hypothetical protein